MPKRTKIIIGVILGLAAVICVAAVLIETMQGGRHESAAGLLGAGGVCAAISTAMFFSARQRGEPMPCPKCGSKMRAAPSTEEQKGSEVVPVEKCASCGHVWEPMASRLFLLMGIAAGALFLLMGVMGILSSFSSKGPLLSTSEGASIGIGVGFVMAGGGAIVICANRLRERAHRAEAGQRQTGDRT